MTGKEKCNLLRAIRREIAKANGIVYLSADCTYEGECVGTCSKCDAEARYLDSEINRIASEGKQITLAGLSLDIFREYIENNDDEEISSVTPNLTCPYERSVRESDDNKLFINIGNVAATAVITPEGFTVLKGSTISATVHMNSLNIGVKELRDRLFAEGKVKNSKTTEDILFSSSSAAAKFILGYSESGPRVWKTKDGRALKEVEKSADSDSST